MNRPLHNLFGIVFILICFCSLVVATIWQYLIDHGIEDFSQKYERFLNESFAHSLGYFFIMLFTLLVMALLSFIFWFVIVFIYALLVRWPHDWKRHLAFKDLFNTYTITGLIMIYAWFFVFLINNTF